MPQKLTSILARAILGSIARHSPTKTHAPTKVIQPHITPDQALSAFELEARVLYSASPIPMEAVIDLLDPVDEIGTDGDSIETTLSKIDDALNLIDSLDSDPIDELAESTQLGGVILDMVFIDYAVDGHESLIEDIESQSNTVKIVVLDENQNGIDQISGHLADHNEIAAMLKRIGLTYDLANNGFEALERISENKYDLVLMDMNMPVMDGLTATRHIRETGLQIPVVALTAMVIPSEKKKCLDGGCNSFLSKLIRHDALVEVLSDFLVATEVEVEVKAEETPTPAKEQTPPQPATKSETPQHDSTPTVVMPALNASDVESGLAATLASLGIDDLDLDPLADDTDSGLVFPDVVRSSLPSDPEYMTIVSDFVDRLPAKLEEFDRALEANSTPQLSDLGHWLAGAASTVGLDPFVAPARELEYSDGSDPARQAELVQHFHDLASRISCDVFV